MKALHPEKHAAPRASDASKKGAPPPEKSPSERHPGRKPEEADPKFEDLQVRDSGNRR